METHLGDIQDDERKRRVRAKIRIEKQEKNGFRKKVFLNDIDITKYVVGIDYIARATEADSVSLRLWADVELVEFEKGSEDE